MEIGQHNEMGKLLDADNSGPELQQKLDARGDTAPVLIRLEKYSIANVSNGFRVIQVMLISSFAA